MLDVGKTKLPGLLANRRKHQTSLRAARRFDLPGSPLEFDVGATDDGEKMIKPWKEVVFALVPALGAFLEDAVVVFFRFFDKPLQADVSAHFIAVLIER